MESCQVSTSAASFKALSKEAVHLFKNKQINKKQQEAPSDLF